MLPARSLQPLGEKIHECADLGGWARPAGKDRVDLHRVELGTDGIIAYAEINPDYTQRPDPSELLPVLDRLRDRKAA
jgi:hypothetical protein